VDSLADYVRDITQEDKKGAEDVKVNTESLRVSFHHVRGKKKEN